MTKKAPGQAQREGLTLLETADVFRDEDTAREWIAGKGLRYCDLIADSGARG